MTKLNNKAERKIGNDGTVPLDEDMLIEVLYSGQQASSNSFFKKTDAIEEYNKWAKIFDLPQLNTEIPTIDHHQRQKHWFMPEEYKTFDIEQYVLEQCQTQEQMDRCVEELFLFSKANATDLLRYIKYLIDTMTKHHIVWGVGRGSCVSSLVLYVLGLHMVDPIKYNLDYGEFFKNE